MNEDARRVYRRFSTFFLVTGLVFVALGVLRAGLLPDVLRGNPLPVAALLLLIGGSLRWTVRRRPDDGTEPRAAPGDDAEDAGDAEGPHGRGPDAEG